MNDPDTEPPPTNPEPKPTSWPCVKLEIANEPPSVVMILDAISASLASWTISNVKSETEPWTNSLKLIDTSGVKETHASKPVSPPTQLPQSSR